MGKVGDPGYYTVSGGYAGSFGKPITNKMKSQASPEKFNLSMYMGELKDTTNKLAV